MSIECGVSFLRTTNPQERRSAPWNQSRHRTFKIQISQHRPQGQEPDYDLPGKYVKPSLRTGKIRSFDTYSVLPENNAQEQLIFKHAISTVVSGRVGPHTETRVEGKAEGKPEARSQTADLCLDLQAGCSLRLLASRAIRIPTPQDLNSKSLNPKSKAGTAKGASLVEAQDTAAREARTRRQAGRDLAVLVAVEFTGQRRRVNRGSQAGARCGCGECG